MKVSIIVPIYNKEKYLRKCIDSILSQTYKNIELILVDDGSTDGSFDICNSYGDERIVCLKKHNSGVSSARNVGLKYATGDKIMFVDADDYIERNYIEKYLEYEYDFVVGGYVIEGVKNYPANQEYKADKTWKCLKRKNAKFIAGPVSKMFDRKIISQNSICFDETMNFGEDTCFVMEYLKKCRNCVFIDYAGYINRIVDGTLSRKYVYRISAQLKKVLRCARKVTKRPEILFYWHLRSTILRWNNKKMLINKKVGIVTVCGNHNFGNKLQNYAIVNRIGTLGYYAETIWIQNCNKGIRDFIYSTIKLPIMDHIICRKRRINFMRFNKFLNIKNRVLSKNSMKKAAKKYDYILVGSDQVWNPYYFSNDSIFLLDGIKCRKSAFSASFGVSSVDEKNKNRFKKPLKDFNYISVREDRGKEIVKELSGRDDAEVLIDPTMLLNASEWDVIAKKPMNVPKRYILCYFLGKLSNEREAKIARIAKKRKCEIINILDKNSIFYNIGPREFLYLEKHAELICTDSFHSSVFAIIYNRPFVIFEREEPGSAKMNSRLDTLVSKFKLKNRFYNGLNITKENLEHDYSEAYKILKEERKKSLNFLEKVFKER